MSRNHNYIPIALSCVVSLCGWASVEPVRADLLLQTLPKDGAWVTFQCSEEYADGTKRELWLTIKSVGQDNVDEQACRWIELKYQNDAARQAGSGSVMKFLIPEKVLATGGDPFGHVRKAWKGSIGEQALPIDDVAPLRHRLNLVLSPPIKDLKKSVLSINFIPLFKWLEIKKVSGTRCS